MRTLTRSCAVVLVMVFLAGCVAGPTGPYAPAQPVMQAGPVSEPGGSYLMVGPQDRTFVLRVDDRTPFGLGQLPQSMNMLYQKGYDMVRRDREADFGLEMAFVAGARDNPEQRAGNMVGGALLGAATGAIIGGALGHPGRGAAIGAGSGAALGLVAPAGAAMVQINIRTQSFRDGATSARSAMVDLANVPPQDVQRVVDMEVARMLDTLPVK